MRTLQDSRCCRWLAPAAIALAAFLTISPTACAENDKVVALGYEHLEVKADGRSYRSTWAHVYTLRNGKVVKFEEFVDTAAQAAAFAR